MKVCRNGETAECAAAPKPVSTPAADFPEEALRTDIKHTSATLSCVIGIDGMVHDINVDVAAGHGFDESAIKALKQWTFQPGTYQGHPVPVKVKVVMKFNHP